MKAGAAKKVATATVKATEAKPAAVNFNAKVNIHGQSAVAKPLIPIGEGAYQSAEAVAQCTLDADRDCEKGKWNGCLHNDKADIVDGHSYGHLRGEAASVAEAPAPPPAPLAAPKVPKVKI